MITTGLGIFHCTSYPVLAYRTGCIVKTGYEMDGSPNFGAFFAFCLISAQPEILIQKVAGHEMCIFIYLCNFFFTKKKIRSDKYSASNEQEPIQAFVSVIFVRFQYKSWSRWTNFN
jgi:hypothetical protein